jgi:ribosomal protein S18 acetylase RimI-like enzyme
MEVRNYQPGDLEGCRALWVALTERHRHIYEAPWIGGDDPGRQFDAHLEKVGSENLWVAEQGGRPVGLGGLILGDRTAELEPLVVLPSYRGRGIGKRLVNAARKRAIAAGATTFNVRAVARNAAAIAFYREAGFNVIGYIEMFEDLREPSPARWIEGQRVAGVDFLI